ncbi:hypothetical protein IAU60_001512 [Kwoniella sp. DSM 27419]
MSYDAERSAPRYDTTPRYDYDRSSSGYDTAVQPRYDPAPSTGVRASSPSQLPSPPASPAQDRHAYSRPHQRVPVPFPASHRPPLRRSRPSILDELLPTPSSTPGSNASFSQTLRRSGSLAVICIFLLSISFMAGTASETGAAGGLGVNVVRGSAGGLRKVFGVGSQAEVGGWVSQDLDQVPSVQETADGRPGADGGASDTDSETEPDQSVAPDVDFDHYKMLMTLPPGKVDITTQGRRMIFIGDVHGSYDPLLRLMDKISYNTDTDRLIHVGDLIAKGDKNEDVLWWMNERRIMGVRGNHDQAVIQWRAWMEWAGGQDWEAYVDSLAAGGDEGIVQTLVKEGKAYPESWKWKGEHWKIARTLPKGLYLYLLDLPLVLHLPSLHTLVVHAGVLPSDPLQPPSSKVQPLVQFSNLTTDLPIDTVRNSEEVSILFDIPQNTVPWNLLNMRGVYTKGKKKGKVTKSGKKGSPWSDVWKKQMSRCTGAGQWTVEHGQLTDETLQDAEDQEVDEDDTGRPEARQKPGTPAALEAEESETAPLGCSPVTVIYGHAAGRGLDIKPFSKGLDTGAVYGRQLTALVLGDLKGLEGKMVRVGDHQGILVSEECGKGGT